jgi:L-iditol 2-dehydrogenase
MRESGMKALMKVQRGDGFVELREVEEPRPGAGEVLVEVRRAGICFTDIHILHDEFPKAQPPFILGHEFSGVIRELGAGVEGWMEGERVVSETAAFSCGRCRFCQAGDTQLCPERKAYGYVYNGAFAKYISVRSNLLHRIPDSVSDSEAALSEPLACCTHAALERVRVEPHETVLITGPGAIGLLMLQVVKSTGAKVILCGVDSDAGRLKLGKDLGADHTVNVVKEDLTSIVMEMTQGYGVDKSFECAGVSAAAGQCLRLTRKGGTLVQVGLFGKPVELAFEEIALKELTVVGSFAQRKNSWDLGLKLLGEGKVKTGPLVSGEYPLDRWEEAFRKSEGRAGIKYLLCPVS